MSKFYALVDSDAFVARFFPDDFHHQRASTAFAQFERDQRAIVTTSMVVAEVATVLSNRSGHILARKFLDVVSRGIVPVMHIDETIQQVALNVFAEQEKRGMSVTDCANVVVMRQLAIPKIFSFDKAYQKIFRLSVVE